MSGVVVGGTQSNGLRRETQYIVRWGFGKQRDKFNGWPDALPHTAYGMSYE